MTFRKGGIEVLVAKAEAAATSTYSSSLDHFEHPRNVATYPDANAQIETLLWQHYASPIAHGRIRTAFARRDASADGCDLLPRNGSGNLGPG